VSKFIFEQLKVQFDLQHQRNLVEKIELFLDQEVVQLEFEHKEITQTMSYMEKDDFLEQEGFRIDQIKFVFPQLQRTSSLISLYLILEQNLNHLCEVCARNVDSGIELNELANNNLLNRAKIYLVKVQNLTFPDKHESWKEILKLQEIRNALVHNNGKIKTGNSALISYIKQCPNLELNDFRIVLKRGYVEHACLVVEHFFGALFAQNET